MNLKIDDNLGGNSQKRKPPFKCDLVYFRYKIMTKVFYFMVYFGFTVPLVYMNRDYLFENAPFDPTGDEVELDGEGTIFFVFLVIVTVLNIAMYLRTALADPGYINSMMFNKAYLMNNETEISQQNLTQQDQTYSVSHLSNLNNFNVAQYPPMART
jgi:hypothetical protein